MRRFAPWLIAIAILIGWSVAPEPIEATDPAYDTTSNDQQSPEPCHEDEPCWNCETMGNRICGPLVLPDTALPAVSEGVVECRASRQVGRESSPTQPACPRDQPDARLSSAGDP